MGGKGKKQRKRVGKAIKGKKTKRKPSSVLRMKEKSEWGVSYE